MITGGYMTKRADFVGRRFNRLVVLELSDRKWGKSTKLWKCICDCGNIAYTSTNHLNTGHTQSCGCFKNDNSGKSSITHGMCGTTEHNIYRAMKLRCYCKTNDCYKHYGGRGIRICDRWLDDFLNFYKDMGGRPSTKYSIDRIDVNGNYSPENCRWATMDQQANNKRNNTVLEYRGVKKNLIYWSRIFGIKAPTLIVRLNNGMSIKDALETEVKGKRMHFYDGKDRNIGEIAKMIGMCYGTLKQRLDLGWSIDDAVNKPINKEYNWRLKSKG